MCLFREQHEIYNARQLDGMNNLKKRKETGGRFEALFLIEVPLAVIATRVGESGSGLCMDCNLTRRSVVLIRFCLQLSFLARHVTSAAYATKFVNDQSKIFKVIGLLHYLGLYRDF